MMETDDADDETRMSNYDADLVFAALPKNVKDDVKEEAREEADEELVMLWNDEPIVENIQDDLASYGTHFGEEYVELRELDPLRDFDGEPPQSTGNLEVALTGDYPREEFYENALSDWADAYLRAIRGEIRRLQQETVLSPREFVAFVLSENPRYTWDDASDRMRIARGTYGGKMSNEVRPKIQRAKQTVEFVESVQRGFESGG